MLIGGLGLLLSFLPFWMDLEEQIGLGLLFSLRGSLPSPDDVVVVSIDQASADALGELPSDPAKWPRSLHARLIENLTRAGAKVIAFDLFFAEPRAASEDAQFADAIAKARNVVLAKYLVRETLPLDRKDASGSQLNVERLMSPMPIFADAAVGSAPFPLPKVPVRLSQYWKFASAGGGVPTLPVVAFQVFCLEDYGDLLSLLAIARPDRASALPANEVAALTTGHIETLVLQLRTLFASDPALADAMRQAARTHRIQHPRRLQALIRMYEGPEGEYLNFYGPPRTVRIVPYHEVASAQTVDHELQLRGKAVFVGVSDYDRPEQRDGFHTVFSKAGIDLSGAEIAAMAFANLLNEQHVRTLGRLWYVVVILVGGMLVGSICVPLAPGAAAATAIGFGAAYLAFAVSRFAATHTWYPLAAPLLFEVPAAFVAAILWRYVDTNRERRRIRRVFSQYLPNTVIEELLLNTGGAASPNQAVYGICLATDAERYTSLAESMDPAELARFVNRYYAMVFEPIRRHGGTISDVIGDAALAIWASPAPDMQLRSRACHAACELSGAVDRFNRDSAPLMLPTRMGLHSGQMVLGHVGAMDHYEYRAIGDIVNTATRIEGLNKRFGTRMLASEDVVTGLDGFLTRRLGTFLLAGKSKPLVLHELICQRDEATARQRSAVALFGEGVAAYEARSWAEASEAFQAYLKDCADDGAAQFYLIACSECLARDPHQPWEPVFRLDKK